MNLRRFTMTNPTAAFSILAHEAWDHKISDGENDDDTGQDNEHNASRRSRYQSKVSKNNFHITYSFKSNKLYITT